MNSRNKGFTLIELMISLTLGLLIVAAATFMFVSSKQSFSTQEGLSDVQESGRTALRVLTTTIRYAGYVQDPHINTTPSKLFLSPKDLAIQGRDGSPPTTFDDGTKGYDGSTSTSTPAKLASPRSDTDSLIVSYYGNDDKGVGTCLGDTANDDTGAPILVTNIFYLKEADTNGLSALHCFTRFLSKDGKGDIITRSEPLVDGVTDFQVRYLVDSDSDGTADRLMTGTEIEDSTTPTAKTLWRSTKSAQITITFASLNVVNKQATSNSALDKDGRILRTFSATIATRNPFTP